MADNTSTYYPVCTTSDEKNRTSIIVHTPLSPFRVREEENSKLNFKTTKTVTLVQDPSETLSASFSLEYHYKSWGNDNKYIYSYNLTVENIAHETFKDLYYETNVKALIRMNNNDVIHVLLGSDKRLRTSRTVTGNLTFNQLRCHSVQETIDKSDLKISQCIHICCDLYRCSASMNNAICDKDNAVTLLMDKGLYSDATIVVGSTIFPTHKDVLSSKSEVFKTEFSSGFSESINGKVEIRDFTAEVVKEFLVFMYTGEAKISADTAEDMYKLAHRYRVEDLMTICERFFIFNLSPENTIHILDLANVYDLPKLKDIAMTFILEHGTELVQEKDFELYLISKIDLTTVVGSLKISSKYNLIELKNKAFEFVAKNNAVLAERKVFTELFVDHANLMQEMFAYNSKNMIWS